jgi:tRNA(Ile)-lysidine synthase
MFPQGSRCLVMVSGGQDSLALLHILSEGRGRTAWPAHLHALHINHHLRGDESNDDEALVIRACGSMGVDLTVLHRPVEKSRGNVQEEARDARRGAALTTAAESGCDRIALGHTADDQVETMLYRLGRYGGLASFAAMRPSEPPWVRPLLESRRAETAAYCRENGLEFARDRGNAYPGYARTAIREQVVPTWETALPGAVEAACRAAEVAAEMQELAAAAIAAATARVEDEGGEWLSAAALGALEAPLRRLVLHAWLEARARPAASRAAVLAVESLLQTRGSAERSLAGGCRVVKEYDRVFLMPGPAATRARARSAAKRGDLEAGDSEAVPLPVPGEVSWGGGTIRAELVEAFRMPDGSHEVFVDAAAVGPLFVRGPLPGDRLRPFGAPGRRKLQDIFVDLRVPAAKRAGWPLVVSGAQIVWVCGLVQAQDGRITGQTKEIVRLSWERM